MILDGPTFFTAEVFLDSQQIGEYKVIVGIMRNATFQQQQQHQQYIEVKKTPHVAYKLQTFNLIWEMVSMLNYFFTCCNNTQCLHVECSKTKILKIFTKYFLNFHLPVSSYQRLIIPDLLTKLNVIRQHPKSNSGIRLNQWPGQTRDHNTANRTFCTGESGHFKNKQIEGQKCSLFTLS